MEYEVIDDTLKIKISSLTQKTIADFLDSYILSRKYRHLLIQDRLIFIDDRYAKRDDILDGEYLKMKLYPVDVLKHKGHEDIDVIYEDELCLIVYKRAGLLVHSDGNEDITLEDLVDDYLFDSHSHGKAKAIHRLDKETQGLVFFSKTPYFQSFFDKELEFRRIKREYVAYVLGKIDSKMTIDVPIGRDRHDAKKMVVYKKGQSAKTIIEPIAHDEKHSLVRCILKTGRTHQIRVHLSHIGHPIINDPLYGVIDDSLKEMGLCADRLSFYHPLKEEFITVSSDIPKDMVL